MNRPKFFSYERRLRRSRSNRKGLRGLREGLNTKELEEHYLKYLPEEGQRSELSYLMIPESQVVLRQKLQEKEYENLTHLLQIVRRNRQQVHQVLLYAFGALLALALIFGFLLRGPLFAKFLESRLEQVLGSPVTIYQPALRLDGTLQYNSIGIGKPPSLKDLEDAEAPGNGQRNIIELGPGSLKISLRALFMGKLWLEDFLSENIELNGWDAPGQKAAPEPDIERPLPLSFAGIMAEARRSFSSFQIPTTKPVASATWEAEIAKNQSAIQQNYNLLAGVAPNQVAPSNSQRLQERSRELSQDLVGQISDVNGQVKAAGTEFGEYNSVLLTLNAALAKDLATLQSRILGGNVLQAPLLYMLESYLRSNLSNFNEISLWFAGVLKNLQQNPKMANKRRKGAKASKLLASEAYIYRYPALAYPDFELEYFASGWQDGQQHNIKIANLSSDGDVVQNPIVAEYRGLSRENKIYLALLYDNRQQAGNRLPQRECTVFGIDICDPKRASYARYQTERSEFQVSRELLSKAGLDFIRSYGGDLNVELVLGDAAQGNAQAQTQAEAQADAPVDVQADLFVELTARLSEVNLLTSGDINVLQEELIGVLADSPLEIKSSFYLSQQAPQDLLQVQMSSNITEILSDRSRRRASFGNTVAQLNSRLTQEYRNKTQSLLQQVNELYAYRTRLQQQAAVLAQQKATADRAPQLIQREAERQGRVQQSFRYLEPQSQEPQVQELQESDDDLEPDNSEFQNPQSFGPIF